MLEAMQGGVFSLGGRVGHMTNCAVTTCDSYVGRTLSNDYGTNL